MVITHKVTTLTRDETSAYSHLCSLLPRLLYVVLSYSTVPLNPLARYVRNYKQSMRNVAAEGIDILCYNFMPVVDWTRTDLEFEWSDGSKALKFDATAFAAFDIFILRRAGARKDYTEKQVRSRLE